MSEFMRQTGLPCDDRIIHQYHEANLLESLSFFESNTKDIDITARWIYIEDLVVRLHFMNPLCQYQCLAKERPIPTDIPVILPITKLILNRHNLIAFQQTLFIA